MLDIIIDMPRFEGEFIKTYNCPYCGTKSPNTINDITAAKNGEIYLHRVTCTNEDCEEPTLFIYEVIEKSGVSNSIYKVKIVHQYPTADGTTHVSIPIGIADSYNQGVRCLNSNAPIGAVTCFRRTLQQICKDRKTSKKDLNDQIDEIIPENLKEIAHEIRIWGNLGAHPDDIIKNVKNEDGIEIKDFLDSVFETLYITPFRVLERQKQRKNS